MSETPADVSGSLKPVPAVMRAAAILDCIAKASDRSADGYKLADIVRLTRLPKSSVHGLCQTLVHLKLLEIDPAGRFCMGPKSAQWANAFLAGSDIVDTFQDVVAQTPELHVYTLTLSHLEGPDVIYQACRNSNAPLGITFRVGMRAPAVFTATGKAMLAAMSVVERKRHLPKPWPAPLTPTSVASIESLDAEMIDAQVRGYSLDNGQLREGMICIGSAIVSGRGQPIAGIGLSLMSAEARPELLNALGERIRLLADNIGARLGAVSA
ncbi:IclR family transcriptional regulator [Brucella sp. BE17]|uniref:IclR family transcriptional regulator n=1 Tax=Brucella sp. BE17 TaxID=3142977 RepID=UPI0031BAE05A